MSGTKRKTGTLSKHIQAIVKEERAKLAAEMIQPQQHEKQETRPLQIDKYSVQSPQDIIKTFSTEEIQALIKACHTELQLRGTQTVPDLSVLLQEWKRLHGIDK